MSKNITTTADYRDFIIDLKSRVQSAQIKAALKVNEEMVGLYWDIGREITERQKTSGWGDEVIENIARDLTRALGDIKGFSRANLYRMKRFYRYYGDQDEFVAQLVRQIPWGHNILLFQKLKDPADALWYAQKAIENGWARSTLQLQVESGLYERLATPAKIDNFSNRLPTPQSDLFRESLQDPYCFDFLNLGDEAAERDIERALVDHIVRFLLELGKGFAFVGKQYHLEVGGDAFYIDLLFYHLKLHRYVVIELKNGPFKPEYAGKLNFYLTALDREVKTEEDHPSIGLILCKDKNNIVAEYALQGMSQPIGVSEFQLTKAIPDDLKGSLPTIEEVENELGGEQGKKI